MDADETLRFLGALYAGFPDWHYDNDPPVLVGDGRWGVKWRQGGTHTGKLKLPGFVEVEATNRVVAIPEHYFYYSVDETGLKEIRPDPVPAGAPHGVNLETDRRGEPAAVAVEPAGCVKAALAEPTSEPSIHLSGLSWRRSD